MWYVENFLEKKWSKELVLHDVYIILEVCAERAVVCPFYICYVVKYWNQRY